MIRRDSAAPGLRAFTTVVRLFCMVPLFTGLIDIFGGVWIIEQAGAVIPADLSENALLNNQIAFWGAIWFGFGICLWWVSRDPLGRFAIAQLLFGVLFLAGLARLYGVLRWGYPGPVMAGAMTIELAISPVLHLWLKRLKKTRRV